MLRGLLNAYLWGQSALIAPQNDISLSERWELLGPFQIGTREAPWGCDPLELHGGFRSLEYDAATRFPSSLGPNGSVGWSLQSSRDELSAAFPEVDWPALQAVYGWAALQYQAWARTTLSVAGTHARTCLLYVDGALELRLDGELFFGGDFYAYRRSPLVVVLEPGDHRLDVRLIRDVRAMGGTSPPTVSIKVEIQTIDQEICILENHVVLPEAVEGRGLVTNLGSIAIVNAGRTVAEVVGIESADELFSVSMVGGSLFLLPGQTRPVAFNVESPAPSSTLSLKVRFKLASSEKLLLFNASIPQRSASEDFRYTFFHPSGAVSYAILRPPDKECKPRVLINLHGAGVDADTDQVRHMLDAASPLAFWTLFPSGATSWSSDDWHVWGFADVEAAFDAAKGLIGSTSDKFFITGHSNGGQGTWYALTHRPDRVIAAAAVSGYLSIQSYVPFQMWSDVDPRLWMILQLSLTSYKHELLADNFAGIPLLQQHGEKDNNVPPYHSRRMREFLGESADYTELPGKGHWFNGVMTTPAMRRFFNIIGSSLSIEPPTEFKIVIPSSGDMGSRNGIKVDQLASPDMLGTVRVKIGRDSWVIDTTNIRRFHLEDDVDAPERLFIDGERLDVPRNPSDKTFIKGDSWMVSSSTAWKKLERHGAQLGPLEAILRTHGPFTISAFGESEKVALQIARNLYQYFAADCAINPDQSPKNGNAIFVAQGDEMPGTQKPHPIKVSGSGISVKSRDGQEHEYAAEPGLGAIYLAPFEERLELRVWGVDELGLALASRLVPMLTGTSQPDFVIVSRECAWKGAGGVLAAGFFDSLWHVSGSSYFV